MSYFEDDRNVDRGSTVLPGEAVCGADSKLLRQSRLELRDAAGAWSHRETGAIRCPAAHDREPHPANQQRQVLPEQLCGAVNTAGTQVNLSAYNNTTERLNVFNQTDVTKAASGLAAPGTRWFFGGRAWLAAVRQFPEHGLLRRHEHLALDPTEPAHTVGAAIEFRAGRYRRRQSGGRDGCGSIRAGPRSRITKAVQAIIGIRYDRFELDFENHRNDQQLNRRDELISPRAALVIKPIPAGSLYGSYSVSHLPSYG
jgi:catecholate siderophore receptor